jgi:hypothetical protein
MSQVGSSVGIAGSIAPDGSIAVVESDTVVWRYPPNGGPPVRMEWPKDWWFVGWSADSQLFYVHPTAVGELELMYLAAGRPPQHLTTIAVNDRAGLQSIWMAQAVGDPHAFGYLYAYIRNLSTIVVGSGIPVR